MATTTKKPPKIIKPKNGTRTLTAKQEKLVACVASGMTLAESYKTAYPNSRTTNRNSQSANASIALKLPHVKEALEKMINDIRAEERKTIVWTRENHLEKLLWGIDEIQKEIRRKSANIEAEALLIENTKGEKGRMLAAITRQKTVITSALASGLIGACESLSKLMGLYDKGDEALNGGINIIDDYHDE